MGKVPVLLAAMVLGLLASAGSAQPDGEVVKACLPRGQPINPDYERDSQADWPEEARRLKGSDGLATRQGDSLHLKVEGGRIVDLVDCPYGDAGYRYLYERYDQAGPFHVVRTQALEDFSYTLVMMRSGRPDTVYGAPVWASDKSRFLTIGCSLQPPRGSLAIRAPAGEGLATEAEFPLPCESESCSARFDHGSWISVTCIPREAAGKKGNEFVLMRGNNGTWNRFGR